jgi:hypothetical protein
MTNLLISFASVCIALCSLDAFAAAPPACEAKSPAHRVAFVELYTSEGCSSCPPADAWLHKFPAQQNGTEQTILPIAFHVDYWNSIGWTDRFSDHHYTERQNMLAALANSRLVYTPEVFLNGHEVRQWSGSAINQLAEQLSKQPAEAEVVLDQQVDASGHFRVDAALDHVTGKHGPIALQVALYQSNLTSTVKAGENEGATLHHAFAARALSAPQNANDGKAAVRLEGQLPVAGSPADLGFVAFAQDLDSGEIIEAVAAPACSR